MASHSTYSVDRSPTGAWKFQVKPARASVSFIVVSLFGFLVLAVILALAAGFFAKSGGAALAGVGTAFAYFWWHDWGSFFYAARYRRRATIEVSAEGLVAGEQRFNLSDIATIDVRAPARTAQSAHIVLRQKQVAFVGEARAVMLAAGSHGLQSALAGNFATSQNLGAEIGNAARRAQAAGSYTVTICAAHHAAPIVIAGGLNVDCAEALTRDLTSVLRRASGGSEEEQANDGASGLAPQGFAGKPGILGKVSENLNWGFLLFGVSAFVGAPLWRFLIAPQARAAKLTGVALLALVLIFWGVTGETGIAPESVSPVEPQAALGQALAPPPVSRAIAAQRPAILPTKSRPGVAATAVPPAPVPVSPASPNPTAAAVPAAVAPSAPSPTTYAVFDVVQGDTLNVRAAPGASAAKLFALSPLAEGVLATGQTQSLRGTTWMEIRTAEGIGWINRAYVAEQPQTPCAGAAIETLVSQMTQAVENRNGGVLRRISSPVRGLLIRREIAAPSVRIPVSQVASLFAKNAPQIWVSLLPSLGSTLNAKPTPHCGRIALPPGSSRPTAWPPELGALLPVTLAPPAESTELSTWVLGIEYLQAKPYVTALIEYATSANPNAP